MDVVEINRQSVFSHAEAQELLPVIFKITKSYSQKVDGLIERIQALGGTNESLIEVLETQVNHLIHEWQSKVQKLGAVPKGLWIADFDAGDGYFCWKYPERSIDYWHKYSDGYSKRRRVIDRNVDDSFTERVRRRPADFRSIFSPVQD